MCGLFLNALLFKIKNKTEKNKYSCKGVSKKNNDLYFEYCNTLDVFHKTVIASELDGWDINKSKNIDFRVYDQGIVTYEQNKLGLSAHYDKHYVLTDGIIQDR